MKNLIKILFLSLATVFFTACDNDDEIVNFLQTENYVYLSDANPGTVGEGAVRTPAADGSAVVTNNRASLRVERTGASTDAPLDVTITVTSAYTTTTDFKDEGDDASSTFSVDFEGTVTIPAGRSFATFSMSINDDVISEGNKAVTFAITGVSDNSYTVGFPGEDVTNTAHTIVIEDDDCPIDIVNDWEGVYEVTEFIGAPGTNNAGFTATPAITRRVRLVLDESNPAATSAFMVPLLASDEGTSLLVADTQVPLAFNTCPQTLTIGPAFYVMTFNQNSNPARFSRPGATFSPGTFNEDASSFALTVRYGNTTGANFAEFNVTFARVQ